MYLSVECVHITELSVVTVEGTPLVCPVGRQAFSLFIAKLSVKNASQPGSALKYKTGLASKVELSEQFFHIENLCGAIKSVSLLTK